MTQGEPNAPKAEEFKLLTETARDTEMGLLLRRFWHPVALSRHIETGSAKPLRVLGEDLTLYRGESGRAYLVGGRCAHRLTVLHTGWVQGDDIRCMYHGWRYDGTGQCTEMPAEKSTLPPQVRIAGYPVHEYCGLVFAYMGDGPPPPFELPRKDLFEQPDHLQFTRLETWSCNWLQHVENAMDSVHVGFVHQKGRVGTFGEAVATEIPHLEYSETEAGIRQVAIRSENNVRISDWSFPNNNHINVPGATQDDPWIDIGVWVVPVDDERTMRFQLLVIPSMGEDADSKMVQRFDEYGDYDADEHHDELFHQNNYPKDGLLQLTSAQDYVAVVGQGTIADRANERLGKSDAGIVLLRRIFLRELRQLREGRAAKQWTRLGQPADMPIQVPESADV